MHNHAWFQTFLRHFFTNRFMWSMRCWSRYAPGFEIEGDAEKQVEEAGHEHYCEVVDRVRHIRILELEDSFRIEKDFFFEIMEFRNFRNVICGINVRVSAWKVVFKFRSASRETFDGNYYPSNMPDHISMQKNTFIKGELEFRFYLFQLSMPS